jgi:hypothetical protein
MSFHLTQTTGERVYEQDELEADIGWTRCRQCFRWNRLEPRLGDSWLGGGSRLIAGPVLLEKIDVNGGKRIRRGGAQNQRDVDGPRCAFPLCAGGRHRRWHSHPGPVFVMVTAGTLTLEQSDGSVAVYPAGTGFVEEPDRVHIARNESATEELELDAFLLIPVGAPVRIDEPAP